MPTTAQALETYKRSMKNESEHEWPIWVKEVNTALTKGTELQPNIWSQFVYDVFEVLKQEQLSINNQ